MLDFTGIQGLALGFAIVGMVALGMIAGRR